MFIVFPGKTQWSESSILSGQGPVSVRRGSGPLSHAGNRGGTHDSQPTTRYCRGLAGLGESRQDTVR